MISRQQATVGVIANPASGRDIRRLISHASVFPAVEKANMVQRMLGAMGALGIERVVMMPDQIGICGNVLRAGQRLQASPGLRWPRLDVLDVPLEGSAADTLASVERMLEEGVSAVAVIGGDGTNRVVAARCGNVPLATLSSGTNNVFPDLREATVTGLAAGLVALGKVPNEVALRRNKLLRVSSDSDSWPADIALVDVCVSSLSHVGARALWKPETLSELVVTFAESDAVGLSSIPGLLQPVTRDEPRGLYVELASSGSASARMNVLAPIAPGLVADIGVACIRPLMPGVPMPLKTTRGTIALDGEREIEFSEAGRAVVQLDLSGPYTIDVGRTLAWAARNGVLRGDAL